MELTTLNNSIGSSHLEYTIINQSCSDKTNSAGGKYSAGAKYYYQSCSDKNSSAGGKYF